MKGLACLATERFVSTVNCVNVCVHMYMCVYVSVYACVLACVIGYMRVMCVCSAQNNGQSSVMHFAYCSTL